MEIALNSTILSLALVALLAFSHLTALFLGFGLAHSQVTKARADAVKAVIDAVKGFLKPVKEDAAADKDSFKGGAQ